MHWTKTPVFLSFTALAMLAGGAESALAKVTTVHVSLWDKGDAAMATNLGMGMSTQDMAKATMGIKADKLKVKAGDVTFRVTNKSKEIIHEMIVIPVKDSHTTLPYVKDEERVDEDAAHHLGEVAELDPGKSGALSLKLAPGKYALLCDVPGHYMNGMWTVVTVVP